MKLSEIHPYEKNPRFNDDAVEAVANSIKEFGFRSPIVVDKDHIIICGHTRFKAAQSLGLEEVPVVIAADLTPEQVQAYRIADNKTGEIAEWNHDLLPLEIKELQEANFDLSLLDHRARRDSGAVPGISSATKTCRNFPVSEFRLLRLDTHCEKTEESLLLMWDSF